MTDFAAKGVSEPGLLEKHTIEVIYEDRDILVIHKPAGIVVNNAETVKQPTVQSILAEYLGSPRELGLELVPADFDAQYGTPETQFSSRGGMVHRLDKDTSGVLIWAKNPGSMLHLLSQFRNRLVEKHYTCLVHGRLEPRQGSINAPLARRTGNRKIFGVSAEGRPALTEYQVEEYYYLNPIQAGFVNKFSSSCDQGFSLVSCFPKTGRTHQIRAHLASRKHPIVGDQQYAGRKRAKLDLIWCPRQFLHASELRVQHPRTGTEMTFAVPLANDLQVILKDAFIVQK